MAVTILQDHEVPPDWVEIDETKRRRIERESIATMRDTFAVPHPEEPEQHPRVSDDCPSTDTLFTISPPNGTL